MLTAGMTGMELTPGLCTNSDTQQLPGVNCSTKQHTKIPLHAKFSAQRAPNDVVCVGCEVMYPLGHPVFSLPTAVLSPVSGGGLARRIMARLYP